MTIKQKKENDKLTVYIEGRIDTATSPVLSEHLQRELDGVKDLELDFQNVEYISSAGLRVLLFTQKTMISNQGKMVVSHVNDDIMETFELTCFNEVITII